MIREVEKVIIEKVGLESYSKKLTEVQIAAARKAETRKMFRKVRNLRIVFISRMLRLLN